MHIHAFYTQKDPWNHMFRQAVITVTSISVGLCPAAWAERALLAPDVVLGVVHRAHPLLAIGRGEQHVGFTPGIQRGDITVAVGHRKKPLCSFLDSSSEVLLPPWIPIPLRGGRKMPLNLAIAALSIFLPPTNPAQPLMSHNWLLSAPNHFTEVRINF